MFEWLWNEKFWLLEPYTWTDLQPRPGLNTPNFRDIFTWPIIIMCAMFVFRNYFLLPFIFSPIGKRHNVRSKPYPPPSPNEQLEKLYKINRARPPRDRLLKTAAEIGWEERPVQRWLRQKALSQQMTTLDKFNDFGWQLTHYTLYTIAGLIIVAPQPFCWDIAESVKGYPFIEISTPVWWYYMIGCAFYYCQTLLVLTQTRRHDFNMMLTHHIVTIGLITFSWMINLVHFGCIVLIIHECADIAVAIGKLYYYCGKTNVSNNVSVVFLVVWTITRLIIFPVHALKGIIFTVPATIGAHVPSITLQAIMLCILQVLHIMWTMQMIPAIYAKVLKNEVLHDTRSSPDEMSDSEQIKKGAFGSPKVAQPCDHITATVNAVTHGLSNNCLTCFGQKSHLH